MNRIVVAILILLPIFVYLGFRLTPGLGWPVVAILVFHLLLLMLFPFLVRNRSAALERLLHSRTGLVLMWVLFLNMAYISFLGTATIARDFFRLLWLLAPTSWPSLDLGNAWMFPVAGLATLIGFFFAASGPRLLEVNVPFAGLPKALEGFRIAQITDLHVGPTIGRRYVDKVVRLVAEARAHVVVFTGDMGDGLAQDPAVRHALDGFKNLPTSLARYFVTGNHEYYWDGPSWVQRMRELGIEPLLNANRVIEFHGRKILFAGVVDPAAALQAQPPAHDTAPDLLKARESKEAGLDLRILLAHNPQIARKAAETGFDLQISGHTHAGQFFPWTFVVTKVHEFSSGLAKCAKMWVYVSSGTGSWGPPVRMGSRTEVTVLNLTGG